MVVGAFPAAKLGVLAFKQLSKPVANVIKERAKSHPFFRQYVCMPPAQFYNWMEVKTKMWVMNLGKPVNVPQLNEAMAIELGANLLGEVVIFSIGAALLIVEYQRSANKEARKEEMVLQEKAELRQTLCDLQLQVERQDTQMREMNRIIAELESRSWFSKMKFLQQNEAPAERPAKQHGQQQSAANTDAVPVATSSQIVAAASASWTGKVSNAAACQQQQQHDAGNYGYDPTSSLLFKALHLIETEIFYSEPVYRPLEHYGRVQGALAYLDYGPPASLAPSSSSLSAPIA